MKDQILSYQKYHLVGIQGVGMTALALILRDMDKTVSGSDINETFLTSSLLTARGVGISAGFDPKNIAGSEAVVYSGAHQGANNPEVRAAVEAGQAVFVMPEVLGALSRERETLAVCGCHGKTTTTALAAYVWERIGLQASYFVGGPGFMDYPAGKWGRGRLFVAEADEYVEDPQAPNPQAKFLYLSPKYVICTNIDFDHPDIYKNMDEMVAAYSRFFDRVDPAGFLLVNGDDQRLTRLAAQKKVRVYTFGRGDKCDFRVTDEAHRFGLAYNGKQIASLDPELYGGHNMLNIASVLAFCHLTGQNVTRAARAAEEFRGVKRRMEEYLEIEGNYIFDDYAHHPAEIAATLKAFRQRFSEHRLAVIFQPHTYSRTKALKDEFIKALKLADRVALMPVFASEREKDKDSLYTTDDLSALARQKGLETTTLRSAEDFSGFIVGSQREYPAWLYVTMGAGDVYKNINYIGQVLHDYHKQ